MAGTLTRDDFVKEVLDNVAKTSTAQTRSSTTLETMAIRYLNRAQRRIARKEDLLYCIATANTVASQKDYALPSNIRALFTIRLEDGLESVKLGPMMPWEFDRLVPKPDEVNTGRPDIYIPFRTTNSFELFKIPDAVYVLRLRYSFWPADFTLASQVSEYTHMDDVISGWATMYLYYWLQEYADAGEWDKLTSVAFAEGVVAEREGFPDWEPVSRGFNSQSPLSVGEYWNDPLIREDAALRSIH